MRWRQETSANGFDMDRVGEGSGLEKMAMW